MLYSLFTTVSVLLAALAVPTHAGVEQKDFTGIGHIYVLKSDDWSTATPKSKVGCLNDHGKFIKDGSKKDCGVFERLDDFPYTLSTTKGNCTFDDASQEKNTDSHYGQMDYAWNCNATHTSDIYDQLYTINGFLYVFLCFGDIACFYDAKRIPKNNETLSLWQFHWGSEQTGITPGHIQLQLLWEKIGELPKRESTTEFPGPRVEIQDDAQVPLLQGARARA